MVATGGGMVRARAASEGRARPGMYRRGEGETLPEAPLSPLLALPLLPQRTTSPSFAQRRSERGIHPLSGRELQELSTWHPRPNASKSQRAVRERQHTMSTREELERLTIPALKALCKEVGRDELLSGKSC